jgi:hypothetical protein
MTKEQLRQMSRKEIRDYLRKNPSDNEAWDIFFEKVEVAPKRKINSDEDLIKIITEKSE